MNRIFISYRSADGKKDAARLAVDLGRIFGDDQVYFDKHDLRGGVSWRTAIASAIGKRPAVLLLMTPGLFGATDAQGRRCIDREEDPIRNELIEARKRGALLLPLLTEDMMMPDASALPDELCFVSEAHALKLRTDDWEHDLSRLVRDLRAHGIEPLHVPPTHSPPISPPPMRRRWVWWTAAALFGIVVLVKAIPPDVPDDDNSGVQVKPPLPEAPQLQAAPMAVEPAGIALAGPWWLIDPNGLRLKVSLTFRGEAVDLVSEPTPIGGNPGWESFAQGVRQQAGDIDDIVYRAGGTLTPRGLEMGVAVYSSDGRGPFAIGNWTLSASPDGRELNGIYRSNSSLQPMQIRLLRP